MRTSFFQVVFAAFMIARAANGCECMAVPVCKWRGPDTAILVGKVVQGGVARPDKWKWPAHFGEVLLDIKETFHGVDPAQRQFRVQVLFTEGMCCQTPYFQGETVLVVASKGRDGVWSDGPALPQAALTTQPGSWKHSGNFEGPEPKAYLLAQH
jgi:hypothetical protein